MAKKASENDKNTTEESPETILSFEEVTKTFPDGTVAVDSVTFDVEEGEFVFIVGRSGAGKTTLLRLLRREEDISDGEIYLFDTPVSRVRGGKVAHLRRQISEVFQDYKLIKTRTVWENVAVALDIIGESDKAEDIIEPILKKMGIWEKRHYFPVQLSGGESQRVAIARAVVINPDVILADEPTADLDPATSWEIIGLLKEINDMGKTVIVATHDFDIVDTLEKRVITLEKGKLASDVTKGKYGR